MFIINHSQTHIAAESEPRMSGPSFLRLAADFDVMPKLLSLEELSIVRDTPFVTDNICNRPYSQVFQLAAKAEETVLCRSSRMRRKRCDY